MLLPVTLVAQTNSPIQPMGDAPVSYASVSQLNTVLSQLKQVSQSTQVDLAKLRIDRWKTDGNSKKQTQSNVDSLQRNLQAAMPTMISDLRSSPENLSATFKLYRNLNALYDVFTSIVESAGAFGSKDEFQSLGNDLGSFEGNRRAIADRLGALTESKEAELARLRTQVRTLQASIPPPAPKKIIVDDNAPPKPASKKKPTTPKPANPTAPKPASSTSAPPK
jgi:hypothetical protein